MGKTRKQIADEAYLRAWGQVDLEEQIALEASQKPDLDRVQSDPIETASRVPEACPACGLGTQQGLTNIFTHMLKRDAGPYRIQCGQCAHTLWCTEEVWNAVKARNAARFGGADVKPPKKRREKKERGGD